MRFLILSLVLLLSCSNCATFRAKPQNEIISETKGPGTFTLGVASIPTEDLIRQERERAPAVIVLEDFDQSAAIIRKINVYKHLGNKNLWIKIDSFGGSVFDGFKIMQAIEAYGSPVTCVVDTKAMSMGFYLLQSCDTRLMTQRSILMAHQPSMQTGGNSDQLADEAKFLKVMHDGFIDSCLLRMTLSKEEFLEKTVNRVWYFGWEEALKYHAIDGIIDPRDIPPES